MSSIYPVRASSVVVGESGQSAVIEHFGGLLKYPRFPCGPHRDPEAQISRILTFEYFGACLERSRLDFVDVVKSRKMTIFVTIVTVFV